jgi:methyl acetate hydrolase
MANTSRIASVLKQAADSGDVPGVVAAAATRDGPIFEGGYGARALPSGEPMTANSYYWIDLTKGVAGVDATPILPFFDVKSVPTFQAFEMESTRRYERLSFAP